MEATIEDLVLTVRTELGRGSDLGFHGAEAIHEALKARQVEPLPSVRTMPRPARTIPPLAKNS